jgi:hypothetical protein
MFNDRRFFTKRLKNHQLTAYEQLFVRFLCIDYTFQIRTGSLADLITARHA